jgi:hypothetical protein
MLPDSAGFEFLDSASKILASHAWLVVPAQPVVATPFSALVRQCFRGRTICLSAPCQNLARENLTLVGDFGFCFQCQMGSSLVLHRPIEITRVTGHLTY